MDNINFFKDLIESIPDYEKIVFLIHLNQNDVDLLNECGYLKRDFNRLNL